MSTLERIQAALSGLSAKLVATRDASTPTFEIEARDMHAVCAALRDRAGFDSNTFVTAIDHYPSEPRFKLCAQFLSVRHNDRVRVEAWLPGVDPKVATIVDLWLGAAYAERECYDMFGIQFEGHVGLKRLMMPDDYDHFPLRKDFPHQGIEPDRLYREWDRRRRERHPITEVSES
jgi:NADH-quinone oxidoreductase subunit C